MLRGDALVLDSPGESWQTQGLRDGDKLIEADGRKVEGVELWKLRYELGKNDKSVIKIKRDGEVKELTIHGLMQGTAATAPSTTAAGT